MVTKGILKRIEEIEARADNPWCDKWIGGLALDDIPWLCELARKLLAVAEAARDLVNGLGVEMDDPRLEYVLVQVERSDLSNLRSALATLEEGGE